MKKIKILYLLFAAAFTAFAQEQTDENIAEQKTSFNLNEAIEYSKTHNRTIQNAKSNIQAAEEQKWETISIGLPQINAQVDYKINIDRPFDPDPNNPQDLIGLLYPKNSLTPSVTLSQLIFDGSYIVGLQASKVFLDISKNYKEKTDNEIEQILVNAYMTSLLTDESILILEKNITNIEENLDEATAVVANGLAEEESVEQLQLTLSNLENSMKNFKVLAEVSIGYVKLLLGIDSSVTISLTDNLESLILEYIRLTPSYQGNSIANNIDYKIAINDSESKELLYKLEKSKYLPTISAFVNMNTQGFNESSFFDLFDDNQQWFNTTAGGISLKIPIFTSFNMRSKKRRANINWEISQNSLKDLEQQLLLDLKKVKSEYILASETYENRKRNVALAEKIERKNSLKFREGMASSIDLRTVQVQLYDSQQRYLESIIDVINKKIELKNLLNIN